MAPLRLKQQALARHQRRRQREVIVRRQRPEVGNRRAEALDAGVGKLRKEHAGLAADRRVGHRKVRPVEHREAERFETCVLEIDHPFGFVVDDAGRADLPARRLVRVVLARLARRIDAALERRVAAARALRARRRETRLVGGLELERIDEAVTELVGQFDDLAVNDLAIRLGEARIAFRAHALGTLLVDDAVGLERGALVVDLDVADREDAVVDVVVLQFVRAHEHLRVRILRAERGGGGRHLRHRRNADPLRVADIELRGGRANGEARAKAHGPGEGESKRHQPAAQTQITWPSADRRGHYPSSWYRSTTKPVRPPASTGNHAAAAGCSSSALLKSSVTLDMT